MQAYGFDAGKVGDLFRNDRVLALAKLALTVTPSVQPVSARYPSELLEHIDSLREILSDAQPGALIGNRSTATKARNTAQKDLTNALRRARYFYYSCSDDVDASAELSRLGLSPVKRSGQRRLPGEGEVPPVIGAPPPPVHV